MAALVVVGVVGLGSGGGGEGSSATAAARRSESRAPATDTASAPTVSDFHDPVPILMYHAIQPAPPGAALPGLFVPEAEFEDEMGWLADHGYHGVTLDQVFNAWNDGDPIATNPVVVSFDDGYQSQYAGARPKLDQLGWPGVLNLEIHNLQLGNLSDAEVQDLVDSGWELDSHTFTHPDVTTLDADGLAKEIGASRRYLSNRFGAPVNFFCYPAGAYDDASIAAVKAAGYEGATTTEEGLATPDQDPYALSRIRIDAGDGVTGLEQKLSAAGA